VNPAGIGGSGPCVGAELVGRQFTEGSGNEVLTEILSVRINSSRMRIDAAVAHASEVYSPPGTVAG